MSQQPHTDRTETPHGKLVLEEFTDEHMAASFKDDPESDDAAKDEKPEFTARDVLLHLVSSLDDHTEDCDNGLHSWIDQVGKLPANTRCTYCGERYGNPK